MTLRKQGPPDRALLLLRLTCRGMGWGLHRRAHRLRAWRISGKGRARRLRIAGAHNFRLTGFDARCRRGYRLLRHAGEQTVFFAFDFGVNDLADDAAFRNLSLRGLSAGGLSWGRKGRPGSGLQRLARGDGLDARAKFTRGGCR